MSIFNNFYTGSGLEVHKQEQAMTGNLDDFGLTSSVLVLTPDAARDLTGLVPTAFPLDDPSEDVPFLFLVNGSAANTITLKHNSGSSAAANRILVSNGADKSVGPQQIVQLLYVPYSGRTGWWVNA